MTLSAIVPLLNEEENIASLVAEIQQARAHCPISEIILIDDGSTDQTAKVVQTLQQNDPTILLVQHNQAGGQSLALRSGIRAATGPLVVTMDGDGQNDPADIPALYQAYMAAGAVEAYNFRMAAGQRRKRMDSVVKKFTSRTGNAIRSFILKDGVRDTGCSLKLFHKNDYLALPFFNHMHRFLPALFRREHGHIILIDVNHRTRQKGVSKYGFWDRLWAGIFDLTGVYWLLKRGPKKLTITRNHTRTRSKE